jgi:hypothetical protein
MKQAQCAGEIEAVQAFILDTLLNADVGSVNSQARIEQLVPVS